MSTKFPLTVLVMELSESFRFGNCCLTLDWLRRDKNQLADDLSNMKFDSFDSLLGCHRKYMAVVYLGVNCVNPTRST